MKNKTELKQTKRLLKELGIYYEFIRERKKFLSNRFIHKDSIYAKFFPNTYALRILLYVSFSWSDTKNPLLWTELYEKLNCYSLSNKNILNNNKIIKELRKIIKNTQQ